MGMNYTEFVAVLLLSTCPCIFCLSVGETTTSPSSNSSSVISTEKLTVSLSSDDKCASQTLVDETASHKSGHIHWKVTGCQVCNFSARCISNNSFVKTYLSGVPVNVTELTVTIRNKRNGRFPSYHDPIDLNPLSKFLNLEKFEMKMSDDERTAVKANHLSFTNDTFLKLTKMMHLTLNVPLANDTDLVTIVKPLISLKHLDISRTVTLASIKVKAAMSAINRESIKELKLSNFQTIGSFGYSQSLNVSSFFGPDEMRSLTHLDLSHNYLGVLFPSISITFPNLTKLDISYNMLILNHNAAVFFDIFLHGKLEWINIGNQGYRFEKKFDTDVEVPGKFPKGIVKTTAFFLSIKNCINKVSSGNVSTASNNNTLFCAIITCMVKKLSVHFGNLGVPCSLFGTLSDFYEFNCVLFSKFPFFKRAKYVNAENLNWIIPEGYGFKGELCFQNTQILNITFRNNKYWFENEYIAQSVNSFSDVTGMDQIRFLDVSKNEASLEFPLNATRKFKQLKFVQLAKNRIKFKDVTVCQHWPNLVVLNLSQNHLTDSWLPSGVVSNCTLLEVLDLGYNDLTFYSISLDLTGNNKLRLLDISYNDILILPEKLRSHLDAIVDFQKQINGWVELKIVLSGNPLQCVCSTRSLIFAEWLVTSAINLKISNHIICYLREKIHILNDQKDNVAFLKTDCANTALIVQSVVFTALGALVLFMSSIGYIFRWKIRYNLYRSSERLKGLCATKSEVKDFKGESYHYDAFVSYCADDRFWVHDVLMRGLENRHGFKLCIHFRDFPIGDSISNAIIQSVRESKHFIIILSKKSVTRPWCQLELETCLQESQRRGSKLVIIRLEDFVLPRDNVTIQWIVHHQVYLQWTDHPDAKKLFWKRLINHLYGRSHEWWASCCCCGLSLGDYKHVRAMDHVDEDEGHCEGHSDCTETDPLLTVL